MLKDETHELRQQEIKPKFVQFWNMFSKVDVKNKPDKYTTSQFYKHWRWITVYTKEIRQSTSVHTQMQPIDVGETRASRDGTNNLYRVPRGYPKTTSTGRVFKNNFKRMLRMYVTNLRIHVSPICVNETESRKTSYTSECFRFLQTHLDNHQDLYITASTGVGTGVKYAQQP